MKEQKKVSVFLVDDDKLYLESFEQYLKNLLGREVRIDSFDSGEECLKEIERNPNIDIVILDYFLNTGPGPAMNGLEVLKKIKENNPEILVVMLSAKDKLEIAEACLRHGAYEYVVKTETAFIRTQNIIKNLINEVALRVFYPQDMGGEA